MLFRKDLTLVDRKKICVENIIKQGKKKNEII